METKTTRVNPQTGWRLPLDLIRLVRLDAIQRDMRYSEVVRERLEESFARRPEGVEPPSPPST